MKYVLFSTALLVLLASTVYAQATGPNSSSPNALAASTQLSEPVRKWGSGNLQMAKAPEGVKKVWVNTSKRVYYCPDYKQNGKTKKGGYMSEADAIAKGFHSVTGNMCKRW